MRRLSYIFSIIEEIFVYNFFFCYLNANISDVIMLRQLFLKAHFQSQNAPRPFVFVLKSFFLSCCIILTRTKARGKLFLFWKLTNLVLVLTGSSEL